MLQDIPLTQLRRGSSLVDLSINQSKLDASVKQEGILVPITVCKRENHTFLIIDGDRRYWAATRAGHSKIPANVVDLSDDQIADWKKHK